METILIIEDDKRVAELLKTGLEEAGYATLVAYDGEMGLRLFKSSAPNVVISDLILPGIDGYGICKSIRESGNKTPIMLLTALGTTDDKLEGFDVGADDYLVKPFDFRELLARLKVLLRHNTSPSSYVEPNKIFRIADLEIDKDAKTVIRSGQKINLSPKEYALLLYLADNVDKVVNKSDIARDVWATHYDTGTNYIDVYINYLRNKIDKNFEPKLLHTRKGMGFQLTVAE